MSEKHTYANGQVTLETFSLEVKSALKEKALIFLQEAGEEITSLVTRNQVRDTGATAGSWSDSPVLDPDHLAVHMGSNHPNAIWEEFGTGRYAEKGDGRKGWWVYIDTGTVGEAKGTGKHYASLTEAKKAMAILRKKGLPAHVTEGKQARHPFRNAFNSSREKIIRQAEKIFGGLSS